ncbi:MAG: methyl-accepting chemotaxis protein [Acetobacteraceae bacterium]
MNELSQVRTTVSRVMVPWLWAHVPIIAAVAWMVGNDWVLPCVAAALLAGVTTVAWWRSPLAVSTRLTIAVTFVAMVSLVVGVCRGSSWQPDVHMYYFASLAMLAAYCDLKVILVAAGAVALHHLGLNFLAPALVFPNGAQLVRVLLHATILVLEATALTWMTRRIVILFASTEAQLAEVLAATEAARRSDAAAVEQRQRIDAERAQQADDAAVAMRAAEFVVGAIGGGLEHLAAGDLTFRLEAALPPAYETLRTNLNAAMEQLEDALGQIVGNTVAIRSGAKEISEASDDLSHRTEQQAATLEQTAAALTAITSTVRETAKSTERALTGAGQAKADAAHSGQVVQDAVVAMSEIEESARKVSQIIGVIDGIAFQTNLLALNAGVEAARAGDAGRGFAVVASEVRGLAQRSAAAAKEIKALIATSTEQVGRGVGLVSQTGSSLGRIVEQVNSVDAIISEIAASARDQASSLSEVNTAIVRMDQVTQQNAAMVEESTAALHNLANETDELARLTGQFRLREEVSGETPSKLRSRQQPSPVTQEAVRELLHA